MSELLLPLGWKIRAFGDVLRRRVERADGNERLLSVTQNRGVIPQEEVGRRDSSSDYKGSYWRVFPGDIVYNTMRMWQGVSGTSELRGIVSPAYTVCAPLADVDSKFMGYLLREPSVVNKFYRMSQGLVSDTWNLRYSAFSCIEVALPPLGEQRRIADVLDALNAFVGCRERTLSKEVEVKRGLVHALLSYGISSDGKARDIRSSADFLKETQIGRLPKEWNILPLPEVASYQNGGIFPSSEYRQDGIMLVRPGNLRVDEEVEWTSEHTVYLPEEWALRGSEYLVGEGEVLMNLTAQSLDEEFLGRACITPTGTRCLLNQRIARFRPRLLTSRQLLWFFRGPIFRRQIGVAGTGSKVQHLYNGDLNSVLVPVPPEREMAAISSCLDVAAEQVIRERRVLHKLKLLRKGLAEDLLTGRVRVPEAEAVVEGL